MRLFYVNKSAAYEIPEYAAVERSSVVYTDVAAVIVYLEVEQTIAYIHLFTRIGKCLVFGVVHGHFLTYGVCVHVCTFE